MSNLNRFSPETLDKAHRLLEREGAVRADEEFPHSIWWVTSVAGQAAAPYRVQVDYDQATHVFSWITCTCAHGLNTGAGQTHCYHAAAVLILLRREREEAPS